MSQNAQNILAKAGLRKTNARVEIIAFMDEQEGALALADLERSLLHLADRATLYRTLKSFEEAGVVHKVVDPSGVLRYALCQESCQTDEAHQHAHAHFSCTSCGKMICLEELDLPPMKLPEGYLAEEAQLVFTGVCKSCR